MGLAKKSKARLFALALILGCSVTAASAQGTNQVDSRQTRQLLLLTNGQIINGIVAKTSDEISIKTANGSRLVFAKDDVETVCETLSQAYWHKAAQTKATDLAGQKRLLHWCLGQNLLEFAQNQIDIISMMKIKATELEYLHRQLSVALEQRDLETKTAPTELLVSKTSERNVPSKSTTATKLAGSASQSGVDASHLIRPLPTFYGVQSARETDPFIADSQTPLPSSRNMNQPESEFAQVGFTEAITPQSGIGFQRVNDQRQAGSQSKVQKPARQPAVSLEELEKLTKSLPKPAVAMFKRKVEPLLVRSCFAEGCHQNNDAVMPLTRVGKGQLIPRRMSQRNLYSIIKHADPNEPLASPLLAAAITSHGGLSDPIITPATKQFENLATWLIMISNKPNSIHQMPEPDFATRPAPELPANSSLLEKPETVVPADKSPENLLHNRDEIDPHDPDVFNRQFRDKSAGR